MNNPTLSLNDKPIQMFPVPSAAGNLITMVDRCWCCDGIFKKYGGTQSHMLQEFHHPVPRAFGGSSGPTVSLCSGHHAAVHKIAECLLSKKDFLPLLDPNPKTAARLLLLAKIAFETESRFRNDPNRRVTVSFNLPHSQNEMLKAAAKNRGLSVSTYLHNLVLGDINRQFPRKRS